MNTITLPSVGATVATPQYDLALFIGRFQMLHDGHVSVLDRAQQIASHTLVLVGSSGAPRSHRNPWTFDERAEMIFGAVNDAANVFVQPLEDALYNDAQWVLNVQKAVEDCLDEIAATENLSAVARKRMKVTLIGCSKDHSSYYLNMFPAYDSTEAPNYMGLSATPLREAFFHESDSDMLVDNLPQSTLAVLRRFNETPDAKNLLEEFDYIRRYKAQWANAPFPVTMMTTDAMVVQSGHILLVRRGGRPGRGLWALPGGYLGQGESIIDGTIRELIEETKIDVPRNELRRSIVETRVFDDPYRDPRGRVITHASRLDLSPRRTLQRITNKRLKLPDVVGSDDAEFAKWFPLASITRDMMFADHCDIIKTLANIN